MTLHRGVISYNSNKCLGAAAPAASALSLTKPFLIMHVQVLEFEYNATDAKSIETRLNNYFSHHEVTNVEVVDTGGRILVFCFSAE